MRNLIAVLLAGCSVLSFAQTTPIQPHIADADTLQLWHLDETSGNYSNSISGGMTLFNWGQRGNYGEPAFTGFGNAWGAVPATNSNLQVTNVNWAVGGNMRGATGAFTWEMLIRPDLAASSGVAQRLIQSQNDMHLSLTYNAAQGYVYLTYWDVILNANPFQIRLDTLGANAYTAGKWFHVAVTYDGTGSGSVYWTALDNYTGTANQIGTFSTIGINSYTSSSIAFGGAINSGGTGFDGAIDEIRISNTVRNSNDFLTEKEPQKVKLIIIQ